MSTTITVFSDVDTPSPGFSITTVTPAKEELGPGWAMDDVYPPLAELRRALLTDEEWAAMSSWEKDVWEMYYMPDWERLAYIKQILVDTPAAQRAQRHQEILEALRNLGASTSKPASAAAANSCIVHLDTSHAVPVNTASTAMVEDGPEVAFIASTCFITTVPLTCLTDCSAQQPLAAPVLVLPSPLIPTEYVLDINRILVAAVPLAMKVEFPAIMAPTVQLQQLYNGFEFFMPTSSHHIASKVSVRRPIPWPSFLNVHANGEETRPLPLLFTWAIMTSMVSDILSSTKSPSIEGPVASRPPRRPPELEAARDQNCVTAPLSRPWPSFACDIGTLQLRPCSPSEDRAPLSMLIGKPSASYGYTISNVMYSPYAIWCWDILFIWIQKCLSVIRSAQQANENFDASHGPERPITVILMNVLVTVSVTSVGSIGYAPSFLRIHILEEEVQRAPYRCEMIQYKAILFTVGAGSWSLRTLYKEQQSSSYNIFMSESKPPTDNCGILMDHYSRLISGILGVLETWPSLSVTDFSFLSNLLL